MMYEAHHDNTYGNERDFNTHFNTLSITDSYEFVSQFGSDLKEIITSNDVSEHTQSIGIQYPNSLNEFMREGSVVTITEIGEVEYIGIVKEVVTTDSYEGNMILDEGDEVIEVELIYEYDRENDDRTHFPERDKRDVKEVYDTITILAGNMGKVDVMGADIDIDLFCMVSDEFLADLMGCEEELVPLTI